MGALEREMQLAEEAGRQLADARDGLKNIEESMARKDFALPQQAAVNQISTELTAMNYDVARHELAHHDWRPYSSSKRPGRDWKKPTG